MIPARETERMMKLKDVILKAMAKKSTWIEAAEIAGPTSEPGVPAPLAELISMSGKRYTIAQCDS